VLASGANALGKTPDVAGMFTFIKAFDPPFANVGHLYYVTSLAAVGLISALITSMLRDKSGLIEASRSQPRCNRYDAGST
jgi:hypothetical protein